MESKFDVEAGSWHAMQETYEHSPAVDSPGSGQAWQLVSDFQELIGDNCEPDPLFFVECWELGASAAAESLRQRRLEQNDRQCRTSWLSEFDILGTQFFFVHESERQSDQLSSCRNFEWTSQSHDGSAAQTQATAPREWETIADEREWSHETVLPMTLDRAYQLLGLTTSSTQGQVKAAYRRMVSKWHPDLVEGRTERLRQLATAKMAAINEAYHLLRSVS
jgi:DnaJ-domain-containing protein 1